MGEGIFSKSKEIQGPSSKLCTVFENHRKSLIQHCEGIELHLHFEWTEVNQKYLKWSILASFWISEACGQTVLPDRSVLIGQKLVENAKIQKFKCDILSNFQTMWDVEIFFLILFYDITAHFERRIRPSDQLFFWRITKDNLIST